MMTRPFVRAGHFLNDEAPGCARGLWCGEASQDDLHELLDEYALVGEALAASAHDDEKQKHRQTRRLIRERLIKIFSDSKNRAGHGQVILELERDQDDDVLTLTDFKSDIEVYLERIAKTPSLEAVHTRELRRRLIAGFNELGEGVPYSRRVLHAVHAVERYLVIENKDLAGYANKINDILREYLKKAKQSEGHNEVESRS